MDKRKEIINNKLNSLSKSKFRSSFHLCKYMIKYIDEVGLERIKIHAYDFVNKNLKVTPKNDGRQTPTKNHPVFIAQHACGCCCRGCLEKWYNIPKNKELSDNEINYIVSLIMEWIINEYKSNK